MTVPFADAASAFLPTPDVLYLSAASQGPRLASVHAAAQAALDRSAMPWRLHAHDWDAQVERVRTLAARLFGDSADSVGFVPSAGYGLSIAAANLPLVSGDAVLVLDDAFPSNLLPWQQRCLDAGARLHAVTRGDDATAAVLDALERDAAIRIVALEHVHWHDGTRLDLDAISAAVRVRRAALVLDLSQSVGAVAAAIARWQPDFAVAVGHKWLLGGFGLAYLWVAPRWRTRGRPLEQGWIPRRAHADWSFSAHAPAAFLDGARRFDAGGVLDVVRLAMAEAALGQVLAWDVERIARALTAWTAALVAALPPDRFDSPRAFAHFVGVRPRARPLDACARALHAAGIACTVRHGCLRFAPHLHVDVDAAGRVADVLDAVA